MVVQYLRFPSRSARNVLRIHGSCRKFSSSNAPRKSRGLSKLLGGLVVFGVGGTAGAVGLSTYDPSYRALIEQNIPLTGSLLSLFLGKPVVGLRPPALPAYSTPEVTYSASVVEEKISSKAPDTSIQEKPLETPPEVQNKTSESEKIVEPETNKSVETPKPKKKKKKKRKKEADPVEEKQAVVPAIAEESSEVEALNEQATEQITAQPQSEDIPTPNEQSADIIEELITATLSEESPITDSSTADFSLEPPEIAADEAGIIMDALNTLDYEPVLSDTVLELLVGKAASREKAVVATISRLENSMASVVNEVQIALEHHNTISALVSASKVMAQSVSEATDKAAAKENLANLIESSTRVHNAFVMQEEIEKSVTLAFEKLSEVIQKADQFSLTGPVSAARALLSKSKNDYYSSCQTAQEHQVDHALLAHYQKSVGNRKKVLEKELAILQDHFPKQHNQLNQTFDSTTHHHAQVDELNTLITYLSNKVGRLERDLEEQQTAELEKLKLVAEAQKAEDARILEERLKLQKEQLRCDYEMTVQAEVDSAVSATRDECARQAERHATQIKNDAQQRMEQQIRDLTAFWSDEAALRESTVEAEYQCKLETGNKVLEGVSEMLDIQRTRYEDSAKYGRLLNLTTALYQCVYSGSAIDPVKLRETASLIQAEYVDDPLVCVVTNSLSNSSPPPSSFTQLKTRLEELEGQCRKSSLVTSEECGIGSRILSVILSLLTTRDSTYDVKPEDGGSLTLYYLYKAHTELENNNLNLATRYLNQLVGLPRTCVQEWLADARSLLELEQSTKLLMNYAKLKNNNHSY